MWMTKRLTMRMTRVSKKLSPNSIVQYMIWESGIYWSLLYTVFAVNIQEINRVKGALRCFLVNKPFYIQCYQYASRNEARQTCWMHSPTHKTFSDPSFKLKLHSETRDRSCSHSCMCVILRVHNANKKGTHLWKHCSRALLVVKKQETFNCFYTNRKWYNMCKGIKWWL